MCIRDSSYVGAVFNNGELVVADSVFDSNDMVNRGSASVDYGGAAIYNWKEGTLKVTNSNFINNIKNYKNGDNLPISFLVFSGREAVR